MLVAAPFVFVVNFALGVLQITAGRVAVFRSRSAFFPGFKPVLGSLIFGAVGVYMTVLPLYVFTFPKADMSLFAFMTMLAIIPGVLFDKFSFGDSLKILQWFAIFIFIFGAYAFIGFPSLVEIGMMPTWLWLSFTFPMAAALNEAITRFLGTTGYVSPWVNSFWIGVSTVIICGVAIMGFWFSGLLTFASIFALPLYFWLIIFILGVFIIASIFSKQKAYMTGGTIRAKKIVMLAFLVTTTFLVSWIFYGEALTFGKIIGVTSFFIAYLMVESSARVFFKNGIKRLLV